MKLKEILKTSLIASLVVAGSISLAACRADSDGGTSSGPNGDGTGNVDNGDGSFPNDGGTSSGTIPGGSVTEDGTEIAGGDTGVSFICTETAQKSFGATTAVGANGLLGGPLTALLNLLGATSLTDLTNNVKDADLAIDGDITTGSTFTLTASLLLNAIDSLDQTIFLPQTQPTGSYAVFGVQFPAGTLDLSLLKAVTVTTFLGDTVQESNGFDQVTLDLLGQNIAGDVFTFIGLKATKPYDHATISLETLLLSVDVGDAMKVHELCTGGSLVQNPA
jgi:hypothetical protein